MLRRVSDENFNGDIVRGLRLRRPDLDLVRAQDVGLEGADDPCVKVFGSDRPTEFKSPAGASIALLTLKRKK